jgi:hypothetical protein
MVAHSTQLIIGGDGEVPSAWPEACHCLAEQRRIREIDDLRVGTRRLTNMNIKTRQPGERRAIDALSRRLPRQSCGTGFRGSGACSQDMNRERRQIRGVRTVRYCNSHIHIAAYLTVSRRAAQHRAPCIKYCPNLFISNRNKQLRALWVRGSGGKQVLFPRNNGVRWAAGYAGRSFTVR